MRDCWDVYAKSGAVCVGAFLAILGLERLWAPVIADGEVRWASAFAVVQAVAILFIAFYLLGRRGYTLFNQRIYEQIRPAIRERVSALALAGEAWSTVIPSGGPARHVLEETIAHALSGVRESGRDRIAQFAFERGFAAQWVKAFASRTTGERKRAIRLLGQIPQMAGGSVIVRALHDEQPAVRVEAARTLLLLGEAANVGMVFRSVLREPVLTRSLLASELKRHARYLLANTIPDVLAENNRFDTLRCLEFMVAWKRAIPSFDIEPWLAPPRDPLIWPLALALLPYVPANDFVGDHLLAALANDDPEVQCAAAQAAGQLRIESLIPALTLLLKPAPPNPNRRLALACATALAQMGAPGERDLEKIVRGADRQAAAIATEALQHEMVGLP